MERLLHRHHRARRSLVSLLAALAALASKQRIEFALREIKPGHDAVMAKEEGDRLDADEIVLRMCRRIFALSAGLHHDGLERKKQQASVHGRGGQRRLVERTNRYVLRRGMRARKARHYGVSIGGSISHLLPRMRDWVVICHLSAGDAANHAPRSSTVSTPGAPLPAFHAANEGLQSAEGWEWRGCA